MLRPPSRSSLFPCTTLFRSLGRFDLPPLPPLDPAELISLMARDKKARESGLTWVLPAALGEGRMVDGRSEEHTSELQSRLHLVCRLLLEKKKKEKTQLQK